MKKFLVILMLVVLIGYGLLVGCGRLELKDDPCQVPAADGSIICAKLAEIGMSVYDADLFFKLANVELIKNNAYTKDAALGFLGQVEGMLNTATYNDLFQFIANSVVSLQNTYGMEIMLLLDYFNRFEGIMIPINAYDQYLMKLHIKNQRQLLGVF